MVIGKVPYRADCAAAYSIIQTINKHVPRGDGDWSEATRPRPARACRGFKPGPGGVFLRRALGPRQRNRGAAPRRAVRRSRDVTRNATERDVPPVGELGEVTVRHRPGGARNRHARCGRHAPALERRRLR